MTNGGGRGEEERRAEAGGARGGRARPSRRVLKRRIKRPDASPSRAARSRCRFCSAWWAATVASRSARSWSALRADGTSRASSAARADAAPFQTLMYLSGSSFCSSCLVTVCGNRREKTRGPGERARERSQSMRLRSEKAFQFQERSLFLVPRILSKSLFVCWVPTQTYLRAY